MRSTQIKDISRASTARHITVRATVWKPTACKRRHFALRKTAFGKTLHKDLQMRNLSICKDKAFF